MAWLPTLKLLLVQVAADALPPPDSATALQPASALPLSLKLTVPVGATPLTVAVNTTLVPALAGLAELPSPVVVGDCAELSEKAVSLLAWSVTETTPLATMRLCQCDPPVPNAVNRMLPEAGSTTRTPPALR